MSKSEKITYEVDPHNRLVALKSGKASAAAGYRTVLDGRFVLNSRGGARPRSGEATSPLLVYKVLKPQNKDIPDQIKLSGDFSLDSEHNIIFTLDKWNNQIFGNRFTIKGRILDVRDDELAFSVVTRDAGNNSYAYILRFGGAWQADEYNRLTFDIAKEKGPASKLTLTGAWQVNEQNQLVYTYTKSYLKRKEKAQNTLAFKGYWDITKKCRLSYILNKEIGSQFDFEASVGKPLPRGLQYEIGIGAKPAEKKIKLLGSWKIGRGAVSAPVLLFEMPYENGRIKSITFGATCKISGNNYVDFRLKNELGRDLGIGIKLSRRILQGQGEAFFEALRSNKEISFAAGVGARW